MFKKDLNVNEMKLYITPFILIFNCFSIGLFSQNLTYHLFQFDNKIGTVNNKGEVTLEPRYDNVTYYTRGYNNINNSKYISIYNNETHKSSLIDNTGKEYFKDIEKVRYNDNGQFAIYFDDDLTNTGLHVLSIPYEKELIHFIEKVSYEFHGKSEYFFSVVHNGKWKVYNNLGIKIYELGGIKDIDVIEENNKFLALAISSHGGKYLEYFDKDGKKINDNKVAELNQLFRKILKDKEISNEINYDYPSDCLIQIAKIGFEDFSKIECKKYNSGKIRYLCTKDEKQGVLDADGNIVLEPKYDKIETMSMYFKTFVDGKVGLSDINGKIIYQPIFDYIRYEPSIANYIDVKYGSYLFEATFEGMIFAPKEVKFE